LSRLTTLSHNSVSHIEERAPRAFTATGRDSQRMFRAARRHSRFVRFLRFGLPIGCVLAVLGVIVAETVIDPLRALAKLSINIGGLVVSGSKITMQQPRYAGFTQDARPYVVTARQAAQDISAPDRVELDQIRATLDAKDSGTVELNALSGLFETKADTLTLQRQIVITSRSYEARLKEAVINVRSGHIVSEQPVEVIMLQGTLNANRLEILNSGEVVRFEKGVTLVIDRTETTEADARAGAR
jgi:lipopolysaccharide export system protein LptC